MRAVVLALVFLNVLFFGWAHWIDQPAVAHPANTSVAALRLAPALSKSAAAMARSALRCASFGPLTNREALAAVGTALRARSFSPRERAKRGEVPDGYWVYIDNLNDSTSRARALKRLTRAGIRDAAAMATNGQVSVGLFSEQSGAELRATAVRAAGLEPIIKARLQLADEYWYDVESTSDVTLPTAAALMANLTVDTTPAWSACPTATAPSSSAALP
jgi:hypothetical protein